MWLDGASGSRGFVSLFIYLNVDFRDDAGLEGRSRNQAGSSVHAVHTFVLDLSGPLDKRKTYRVLAVGTLPI